MNGRTHLIWGLASGIAFAVIIQYPCGFQLPLLLFAAIIGSLAPDLDHPQSMLGKKVKVLNYGVQHRGMLHSLWATMLLGILFYELAPAWHIEVIAFCIGYLSHLVLDTITPSGISWFYPWGKLSGPIRSDGLVAILLQIIGTIVVIVLVGIYFHVSFSPPPVA